MGRNNELRVARTSMPSPHFAGEPMSRAELAEAVNTELWRTTGRRYGLDAHTIARYERGVIRWPGPAYRSALRTVLGAADDVSLGFVPTRRGPAVQHLAGVVDGVPLLTTPPTRVGWTDVGHVRAATAAVASSENLYGGGVTYDAAGAQLRWARGLTAAAARQDVRVALQEAVGNLAAVVAFSAFDVGDHAAANRCFAYALRCADEAASWALRANTLADMSRRAAYVGERDDALSLVEFAQVRADRISPRARAMTAMLRSRYLAASGRTAEAVDELHRSDDWMAGARGEFDPPWLCYYDETEHQGSTARTLISLVQHTGDPDPALRRLESAVSRAGGAYPRSRVFSQVRMATLLMRTGDVVPAAEIGQRAVLDARSIRSRRLTAELAGLARTCRAIGTVAPAADLAEAIDRG